MSKVAITISEGSNIFYGTNLVESCIQPFIDRWESTDANAIGMDYETAERVVNWHNKNKPSLIAADGRLRELKSPHFVARVLRSWEVK